MAGKAVASEATVDGLAAVAYTLCEEHLISEESRMKMNLVCTECKDQVDRCSGHSEGRLCSTLL